MFSKILHSFRRGAAGAILNSKSEFNRCQISRLQLREEENKEEQEQLDKEQEEQFDQWSEEQIREWERSRTAEKAEGGKGRRLTKLKRQTKEQGGRKKRLKHEIPTNWGEEEQTQGATDVGGADQPLIVDDDERVQ